MMTPSNLAPNPLPLLRRHHGTALLDSLPLSRHDAAVEFAGARWETELELGGGAPLEYRLLARVTSGEALQVSAGLQFEFNGWSEAVYLLIPGAVYNGNRFPVIDDSYPPVPPQRAASDPDQRPRITRVPRLSAEPGPSRIDIPSSDPSTPAIGLWFPQQRSGIWILTPDCNGHGLFGYTIEESDGRDRARISISSPCVRPFAYTMTNDRGESPDRAVDLQAGDCIKISLQVHHFSCRDVQELFDALIPLRNAMVPKPRAPEQISLSAVWDVLEDKFNRENWVEDGGYYAVGVEPMRSRSIHQDWQAGWVGGIIVTHALYLRGNDTSRQRILRNFDFLFSRGQAPSGFFYGVIHHGRVIGDNFRDEDAPWHLLRKSADVLFYGLSTFAAMRARGEGAMIAPAWYAGFRRCADAFVRLWDANGQFGQFIDHDTGELLVSGSASAGIAPAALVLAARALPDRAEDYLRVATAAAAAYDREYLRHGLTNGGPGEIAQCADSESAFGLLESFVTLAEHTGDAAWLDAARRCAIQAASWVFSYDAAFPPQSTFAKLGMRSGGTVLANVQNKHSAPGICTHSGLSLLRLHRLTGEPFFLDLLRDIARALPQYLSRADRPIAWKIPYNLPASPDILHLHPGWMCERVNVTQWGPTELAGEVFYYSCWSEFALALTCAELPDLF